MAKSKSQEATTVVRVLLNGQMVHDEQKDRVKPDAQLEQYAKTPFLQYT